MSVASPTEYCVPTDLGTTPTDVRLKLEDQELRVTWADGKQSVYSLPYLRANCPCAACRTDRQEREQAVVPILSTRPIAPVRAVDGWMVGNYALQIVWSDGHDSGIFDFRYLRGLDERPVP